MRSTDSGFICCLCMMVQPAQSRIIIRGIYEAAKPVISVGPARPRLMNWLRAYMIIIIMNIYMSSH